jgi:hypothetical protein
MSGWQRNECQHGGCDAVFDPMSIRCERRIHGIEVTTRLSVPRDKTRQMRDYFSGGGINTGDIRTLTKVDFCCVICAVCVREMRNILMHRGACEFEVPPSAS